MMDPAKVRAGWFAMMQNTNATSGIANYSGRPYQQALGDCAPCWHLPNQTASGQPTPRGFSGYEWCGIKADSSDLRATCFFDGTCESNPRSGSCEGVSYYWNYSSPGVSDWRLADDLAFVLKGGDGVDGLFVDDLGMFPGEGGQTTAELIGATAADVLAQQQAGSVWHQRLVEGLVAAKKYEWQAFQNGNDVGHNNNNNTVGGSHFDVGFCTAWMAQRCNTAYVHERAITVRTSAPLT